MFRLTGVDKDGNTKVLAAGGKKLHAVNGKPIKNYQHAGPVFEVSFVPSGAYTDPDRNYAFKFDLALFSNLGTYVNGTSYSFNSKDVQEYISSSDELTLYLEWSAPEDYPLSADGIKIGTGPFIAKYESSQKPLVTQQSEEKYDEEENKASNTFTKTFGFRRLKK